MRIRAEGNVCFMVSPFLNDCSNSAMGYRGSQDGLGSGRRDEAGDDSCKGSSRKGWLLESPLERPGWCGGERIRRRRGRHSC